jgi:uncharacterized membrane protein (UPF0127 family)
MFRKEMPQQEGMLFVFEAPGVQCFWMRNTILPLTAAFVADDGTIVNLADMKPMTEDSHCSAKPVRYVLEMNQGWFAKRGIKAGTKLGGRPSIALNSDSASFMLYQPRFPQALSDTACLLQRLASRKRLSPAPASRKDQWRIAACALPRVLRRT